MSLLVSRTWFTFFGPIDPEPPRPEDLYEALAELVHGDGSLVAAFGASAFLWLDRAPPDLAAALPYAVLVQAEKGEAAFDAPGEDPEAWLETGEFTVAVYASTRRSARNLARSLAVAIEAADLVGLLLHDEATVLYCRRSARGFDQLDPDPGPDGEDVWSHTIAYRVIEDSG